MTKLGNFSAIAIRCGIGFCSLSNATISACPTEFRSFCFFVAVNGYFVPASLEAVPDSIISPSIASSSTASDEGNTIIKVSSS
ncbi:hypothetical protein K1719_007430 [Acacia pycnantha]|nr:hypothetical protein K1719_007430 [Acacia pycnantha]